MHSYSSNTNGKNSHFWILDIGATVHISYDINVFINCKNMIHVHVKLPNGSYIVASMSRSLVIPLLNITPCSLHSHFSCYPHFH